jgi:hypothetical protein
MNPADPLPIRTADADDRAWCADLMVRTEPWITRKRTPDAVKILSSTVKECYVAVENDTPLEFVLLDMGGGLPGYIQNVCVEPDCAGGASARA